MVICSPLSLLSQQRKLQFSKPFPIWHVSWSFGHLCGPSVDPHQPVHFFLCVCVCVARAKTEHSVPGAAWQVLSRVRQWLLCLCWWCPGWCSLASHWLSLPWQDCSLSLLSKDIQGFLSTELLPRQADASLCLCFPRHITLHLSWLNLLRFLLLFQPVPSVSAGQLSLMECPQSHSAWNH